MQAEFEEVMLKLQNIVEFYRSFNQELDVDIRTDIKELQELTVDSLAETVDYINDKVESLKSWDGAL